MSTTFRALCAELVTAVDEASDAVDRTSDCVNAANHPELWAQCVDLIRRQDDLIARARAALAQPELAPTDEELIEMWHSSDWFDEGATPREFISIARAALARWGAPAIQPVPVSALANTTPEAR
jgi:hypothetical protein